MPKPQQSKGHALFVDDHEYYLVSGALYRASVKAPIAKDGRRTGVLWVAAPHGRFALRTLRLAAGLPESG